MEVVGEARHMILLVGEARHMIPNSLKCDFFFYLNIYLFGCIGS